MAITSRQNRTLAAEDWTKIYQSFQNADFQSYDFETLRKSMVDYLRAYYPENFNDYIESSEYVALIDLIAWMGQNLAFRTDLNARENFIDTAERRDSVLKLAKLINYNPKRTQSASGLMKIQSIQTSESVFDADGVNLSNIPILWNDVNNENWADQFRTIINSALMSSQSVGKPGNTQTIANTRTEEYTLNVAPAQSRAIAFQSSVNGVSMPFEFVSASSIGKTFLYELPPTNVGMFNVLYRNDNLGNGSVNTGFFLMFKQGQLTSIDFNLDESLPNRNININDNNINNSDYWLYALNSLGIENIAWSAVPAVSGLNVAYNTTQNRNIYQINSRSEDQVSLVFGDGSFANIPKGSYRFYYRTSNGLTYKISSQELQNISISIDYVSRTNRIETLSIRASLQYTVTNASARETLADIKSRAPQQYYTQNRMVSGEDYNIYPYTAYNNIVKVKAVNRTSSGISRYLDLIDPSGKYSQTNIFAQDGMLYRSSGLDNLTFSFTNTNEINTVLNNTILPFLSRPEVLHFYYENYPLETISNVYWQSVSVGSNENTGYFSNDVGVAQSTVGLGAGKVIPNALLKIRAPAGQFFNAQNRLVTGTPVNDAERTEIYVAIETITSNGLGTLGNGKNTSAIGAVSVNNVIPSGSLVVGVIPAFSNNLNDYVSAMKVKIQSLQNFALSFNNATGVWSILDSGVFAEGAFDLSTLGNLTNNTSWMVLFKYASGVYTVQFRTVKYIFESERETNFYFDRDQRIYDTRSAKVIKDQISILKLNTDPTTGSGYENDMIWNVYDNIIEIDGFQNPKRVLVTYADLDNDSIPDNPYLFDRIVRPTAPAIRNRVFFVNQPGYDGFIDRVPVSNVNIVTDYLTVTEIRNNLNFYLPGQRFYAATDNQFVEMREVDGVRSLTVLSGYEYNVGRQSMYFRYQHNANDYRRIDPSTTNIIDLYVLTRAYSDDYVVWLRDSTGLVVEPDKPTTEQLNQEFSGLDSVKSISDSIIMNPARFKPLFGNNNKVDSSLRAIFKVVKNPGVSISDNEVKSSLIVAINRYFDIENWDFGETFYFSELSAYLHQALAPNVASIIIVPSSADSDFGDLFQINAMPYEIITSAATVDDVEIIPSVTAVQLGRIL